MFRNGLRRAYRYYAFTMGPNDFCPGFGDEGLRPYSFVFDRALSSGVFPNGTPRDLGIDRSRSYLMKSSGFAIMRNGGSSNSTYANLTFGDFAGWHSHQDLLSLNLWAGGRILLEEVPRFGMYEHPMDVLWRVDQAHNQLLVDTFVYDCRPLVGENVHWHSDERIDYFSAFHRAYRQVPQQEHRTHHNSTDLIVRRTVVFVKDPGYMLVLDSVRGEKAPSFNRATSQIWHSPLPFRVIGEGLAVAGHRAAGCLLAWAMPKRIHRLERSDDFLPRETSTTVHPPVFKSWHCLRARTWMPELHQGCLGFATVLFPWAGRMPHVSIRSRTPAGWEDWREGVFNVTTPFGTDRFILNPEKRKLVDGKGRPFSQRARIHLGGGRGTTGIR